MQWMNLIEMSKNKKWRQFASEGGEGKKEKLIKISADVIIALNVEQKKAQWQAQIFDRQEIVGGKTFLHLLCLRSPKAYS